MTTNEERREAAKRKLEQRLEAERQSARKRRNTAIALVGVLVLAVAAGGGYLYYRHWDDSRHADCSYADEPFDWDQYIDQVSEQVKTAPEDQKAKGEAYLTMLQEAKTQARTAPKPPARPLRTGTVTVTLNTNRGPVPMTLNRAAAPCNVNAVVALAEDGYYDGTRCHRLVSREGLSVLQCGDPTATGSSGPGWTSPDENPTDLKAAPGSEQMTALGMPEQYIYPRGTVAIANHNGQPEGAVNTGSAQFFVVTKDSTLPATLSIVGHVDEAGMKVIDEVAAGGIDPGIVGTAEDGTPKAPLEIQKVAVAG